eukprot:353273-Chlamydomonas_euryale.AAC.17
MEDLVHEIFTVGPAFKQASNFLWPFKLSSARELFWLVIVQHDRIMCRGYVCSSSCAATCVHVPVAAYVLTFCHASLLQWAACMPSAATTSREARPETGRTRSTSWSPGWALKAGRVRFHLCNQNQRKAKACHGMLCGACQGG